MYTIFHVLPYSNSLIRSINDHLKNRNQLIYVHKLLKGSIFIADSAKFKVPKNKYFDKRNRNSDKIFLKFYKNGSSISPYNTYKHRVPFQVIFKDPNQKPLPTS